MKGKLLLIVFIVFSISSYAQTWNEWFRQKKTQIQYLTQQIGGLQIYAESLGKGYKIAKMGLQSIGDIKKGELNLHGAFISSLSKINPVIRKDYRIAAIIAMQLDISEQRNKCFKEASSKGSITDNELNYIRSVFDNLANECEKEIDNLISITTDDKLQLSDDERLKKLEAIYQSTEDKHQFVQLFSSNIKGLAISRQKEYQELSNTKVLFNLK